MTVAAAFVLEHPANHEIGRIRIHHRHSAPQAVIVMLHDEDAGEGGGGARKGAGVMNGPLQIVAFRQQRMRRPVQHNGVVGHLFDDGFEKPASGGAQMGAHAFEFLKGSVIYLGTYGSHRFYFPIGPPQWSVLSLLRKN